MAFFTGRVDASLTKSGSETGDSSSVAIFFGGGGGGGGEATATARKRYIVSSPAAYACYHQKSSRIQIIDSRDILLPSF